MKQLGNFWRTGKCGGHAVKSGTPADPVLLDEETEAITQGQRWFWFQQEAQLKLRLPWVHATLDTQLTWKAGGVSVCPGERASRPVYIRASSLSNSDLCL